jgi:hypothetical protein
MSIYVIEEAEITSIFHLIRHIDAVMCSSSRSSSVYQRTSKTVILPETQQMPHPVVKNTNLLFSHQRFIFLTHKLLFLQAKSVASESKQFDLF